MKTLDEYFPNKNDRDEILDLVQFKFKDEDNGTYYYQLLRNALFAASDRANDMEAQRDVLREKYHRLAVRFAEER